MAITKEQAQAEILRREAQNEVDRRSNLKQQQNVILPGPEFPHGTRRNRTAKVYYAS